MTTYLAHITQHQDAAGRIVGPVVPPVGLKYRIKNPEFIAAATDREYIRVVLEDAQADIEFLAATLQMVLNEVHPYVRHQSGESFLPEPFLVQIKAALGYATE